MNECSFMYAYYMYIHYAGFILYLPTQKQNNVFTTEPTVYFSNYMYFFHCYFAIYIQSVCNVYVYIQIKTFLLSPVNVNKLLCTLCIFSTHTQYTTDGHRPNLLCFLRFQYFEYKVPYIRSGQTHENLCCGWIFFIHITIVGPCRKGHICL